MTQTLASIVRIILFSSRHRRPTPKLLAAELLPVDGQAEHPRMISFYERELIPLGPKPGYFAVGLSGPNGQFRGVLAKPGQFKAETVSQFG